MNEILIYVAKNGSDEWSGNKPDPNNTLSDGPLATLTAARDSIRKLRDSKGQLAQPVRVLVRQGKYFLKNTLRLGASDSGSQDCPISYEAYQGEDVTISGGQRIMNWEPHEGHILKTHLSSDVLGSRWKPRQLFYNGERQIRARYPNHEPENPIYGGWAFPDGTVEENGDRMLRYKAKTFPRKWKNPSQAELFRVNHFGVTNIIPIKSLDEEDRLLTLTDRTTSHERAPWYIPIPIRGDCRYRIENLIEELDQPGEWCADTDEGIVYFWPPDEDISNGEVVMPILDCLIDLQNTSWITVSGFTFTETTTGDNMHREGHDGYGAMFPIAGRRYCGEAVHLRSATQCCIENNRFYAVGGNAIYLEDHNVRNVIRQNEISHAGACGVVLIGSKYFYPVTCHPMYNEVVDNHIHDCGQFDKYVAGVFLGLCDSNIVGHNLIEDMPHHAINLGNSGYGRNIIEYNQIQRVCRETRDNGAINCWMEDPQSHLHRDAERSGHVIRYNSIKDTCGCVVVDDSKVVADGHVTHGIYMDNYTSNCFIYGNIVIRSYSVGIYIQGGKNNIVENNIIVDSLSAFHLGGWWQPQMEGFMTGNRYCRNVYYNSKDFGHQSLRLFYHIAFKNEPVTDAIAQSDYNIFYNTTGDQFVIKQKGPSFLFADTDPEYNNDTSLQEWQRAGFDVHSMVTHPLFVNSEEDDYRLTPNSPALEMGFQQIPFDQIGIRYNEHE